MARITGRFKITKGPDGKPKGLERAPRKEAVSERLRKKHSKRVRVVKRGTTPWH